MPSPNGVREVSRLSADELCSGVGVAGEAQAGCQQRNVLLPGQSLIAEIHAGGSGLPCDRHYPARQRQDGDGGGRAGCGLYRDLQPDDIGAAYVYVIRGADPAAPFCDCDFRKSAFSSSPLRPSHAVLVVALIHYVSRLSCRDICFLIWLIPLLAGVAEAREQFLLAAGR